MLKYVGKRILYMIGVFFVVSIILFVLFNNVPGDRALNQVQNLRGKVSDETFQLRYQEAREKLGLDDPIPVRYVKWMGNSWIFFLLQKRCERLSLDTIVKHDTDQYRIHDTRVSDHNTARYSLCGQEIF